MKKKHPLAARQTARPALKDMQSKKAVQAGATKFPDVDKTPPAGPLPIPYPNAK